MAHSELWALVSTPGGSPSPVGLASAPCFRVMGADSGTLALSVSPRRFMISPSITIVSELLAAGGSLAPTRLVLSGGVSKPFFGSLRSFAESELDDNPSSY